MPFTPSGFVRDNSQFTGSLVWTNDRDAGVKITSDHHDYHDQDIANGLSAVIRRDGVGSAPTANISWGNFRIVSLANGVAATDGATYGQTITALSLNPSTNILTATRAAGNVTVDLSALVVGGDTSDFARYSNAANPFTGNGSFDGTLSCAFSFGMVPIAGDAVTWTWQATTATRLDLVNTSGAQLTFTGNSGTATLFVNGDTVLTSASFDSANVARLNENESVTGIWTFVNSNSVTLPTTWIHGGGTNSWTYTTSFSGTLQIFSNFGSALVKIDEAAVEGTRIFAGANRVWNAGNWKIVASGTPTGGVNGDCALVLSGSDQGLWSRVSGTWTKIIAGP